LQRSISGLSWSRSPFSVTAFMTSARRSSGSLCCGRTAFAGSLRRCRHHGHSVDCGLVSALHLGQKNEPWTTLRHRRAKADGFVVPEDLQYESGGSFGIPLTAFLRLPWAPPVIWPQFQHWAGPGLTLLPHTRQSSHACLLMAVRSSITTRLGSAHFRRYPAQITDIVSRFKIALSR